MTDTQPRIENKIDTKTSLHTKEDARVILETAGFTVDPTKTDIITGKCHNVTVQYCLGSWIVTPDIDSPSKVDSHPKFKAPDLKSAFTVHFNGLIDRGLAPESDRTRLFSGIHLLTDEALQETATFTKEYFAPEKYPEQAGFMKSITSQTRQGSGRTTLQSPK